MVKRRTDSDDPRAARYSARLAFFGAWSLFCLLLIHCGGPPSADAVESSADQLYKRAKTALYNRQRPEALQLARRCFDQAPEDSAEQAQARLLLSDVWRLVERDRAKAFEFLKAPFPAAVEFAFYDARRIFLQARLSQGQERQTLLEEASRRAREMGSHDLLLEIALAKALGNRSAESLESARPHVEGGHDPYLKYRWHANIARNLNLAQRFEEALAHCQPGLAEAIKAGKNQATLRSHCATALTHLGRFSEGRRYARKALDESRILRPEGCEQAIAAGTLADAHAYLGHAEKARGLYQEAIEATHYCNKATWLGNLALVLTQTEDFEAALEANSKSRELKKKNGKPLLQNELVDAFLTENLKRDKQAAEHYWNVLKATTDPHLTWQAHAGLARLLGEDQHYRHALDQIEDISDRIEDSSFQITFLARLNSFYRSYVDHLVEKGDTWRAFEVAESSKAQVLAKRLMRQVGRQSTDRGLAQRLALLSDRHAFLSFWLAEHNVYVWGVPNKNTGQKFFEKIRLSGNSVARDVKEFRSAVDQLRPHEIATVSSRLQSLSRQILRFPENTTVVLSLDSQLHDLPFDALLANPQDTTSHLVRSYAFASVPSLNLIPRDLGRGLLLRSILLVGDIPEQEGYAYLSNSALELREIQSTLQGVDTKTLVQDEATKAQLLQEAPTAEALHFAGHADAQAENPLDSLLVLNGSPLYARDLVKKDFSAKLVTLSACHVGSDVYAGEGPAGLAWAFLQGGADNVVASLWNVNDKTTPKFMQQFYSHLSRGLTPADALRQAKLWSIEQEGPIQRSPYAWAVFQLYVGAH